MQHTKNQYKNQNYLKKYKNHKQLKEKGTTNTEQKPFIELNSKMIVHTHITNMLYMNYFM